ncbi:E3 ubiquitin protein ligase drip2, partial [Stylosanthes scabra]|nr:E3 ubiquitin protein ligase drip2 [Stylosanthes scabra]
MVTNTIKVVKVKRDTLRACMTCPLCSNLLKDATTISLCLHTFCRKCIYEKLSDEEVDCCPVCNIDLGCLPVEKLRSLVVSDCRISLSQFLWFITSFSITEHSKHKALISG